MSRNMRGGAKPALWVSQNFLTGRAVIRRILDQAALSKTDHVVEIGPGKGHITAALAQRCGRVSAVELAGRLYERLCRTFPAGGPVRLYHQDFLTWPLPKSDYVVFANIPFSITSAILRRLTQGSHPPREAWLVMEKGAAKRYMGRPETTRKSLLLAPWFDCDIAYHFRREDFHPAPGVEVVLFHFKRREAPDLPWGQHRAYTAFCERCFGGGADALRRILTRNQLTAALRDAGLPRDFRSADMRYVQWLCLFRWAERFGKTGG